MGTGGLAFADVEHTYGASGTAFGIGFADSLRFSDTQTGWTVGGGLENAITNHLTTRVEYRFTHLGTKSSMWGPMGWTWSPSKSPTSIRCEASASSGRYDVVEERVYRPVAPTTVT